MSAPAVRSSPVAPQAQSPLRAQDDPYYLELEHFTGCLENGVSPIITAEDGLEAVRLSLATIQSIKTGQPVQVDDAFPA